MTAGQIVAALNPFLPTEERFAGDGAEPPVRELFVAYERRVFVRTNQLFWWLLLVQWLFGVGVALIWSPRAWTGPESSVHPHVIAAVLLGGLLVVPPFLLMRALPYHAVTRHAIALAQVSFSALLIHLTGGRIETHFHVFGSLAFLALYRDWRVLVTATLVVALDHLLRGIWYPLSVYGVPYATAWRTVEHAIWVAFEDVVLIWACFVSRREMWEICRREEQNRQLLDELEQRVCDRTAALEAEIVARERTARELGRSEERYRTLVANIPIGVFETTAAGEVRYANPYLLRLMGLPVETDLAGLNLADGRIIAPGDRARLWSRLQTEREVRGFETTYRAHDGTPVEVVINARLKSNGPDQPLSSEGTIEDVTAQKRAQRELDAMHQQLVAASRQAGMADVATGVLHNVGNVLTSVNITTQCLLDRLRDSRLRILRRVVDTFGRERERLGVFLTEDPAGRQMPDFLAKLETHLTAEQTQLRTDVEGLMRHCAHIREIISAQQSAARMFGVTENLAPAQLFEDAVRLSAESIKRHGIVLERELADVGVVRADRHKVLQILVNLLKNAKDSVVAADANPRRVVVRIAALEPEHIALIVEDNGLGIPPENLTRIFRHGFTTKADGHGFGLHSCVLAARDMKGDLTVASPGAGLGATFTLSLPRA